MSINRVAKGSRREREVIKTYTDKGFIYYRPPKMPYGDKDVFNLFDALVYNPVSGELGFLSVKSGYGSQAHKKDLRDFKPKKVFVGIVEYRNKRKGNEKVTIYNELDIAKDTDYDSEIDAVIDESPIVMLK